MNQILQRLILSALLLGSPLLAEQPWKTSCKTAIAKASKVEPATWAWATHSAAAVNKPNSNLIEALDISVVGAITTSGSARAIDGTCRFPIRSPWNRRVIRGEIPLEAIGDIGKVTVNSLTKISSPWASTKAGKLKSLHISLADDLDGVFGNTVDEGSWDADVLVRRGAPQVDCAPRVHRADGRLTLFCRFEIKVVPLEDFGDEHETFCSISYSESASETSLGEPSLVSNETETVSCIENVGAGD